MPIVYPYEGTRKAFQAGRKHRLYTRSLLTCRSDTFSDVFCLYPEKQTQGKKKRDSENYCCVQTVITNVASN